jgi:hypothetical protein
MFNKISDGYSAAPACRISGSASSSAVLSPWDATPRVGPPLTGEGRRLTFLSEARR